MINLLRQITVHAKLRLLTTIPLVLLFAICSYGMWHSYQIRVSERENALRQSVESVFSTLQWAYRQEITRAWTRQQAQKVAIDAISSARYNTHEYFWINDMQARMIDHPIKKEHNGKDMSTFKDPYGVPVFVEFVRAVQTGNNNQGFVYYHWPRPGTDTPVEKLSFVKGFTQWGWVIGTGVYIDDLRNEFYRDLGILGAILAGCIALNLMAARLIARIIVRGIAKAVTVANAIAKGDITNRITPKGKDEISQLLIAMNEMTGQLRTTIYDVRSAADHLAQASAEIAAGNSDLSNRTEQTAASLQQTSAAMAHLTQSVRNSTHSANEANEFVCGATSIATQGGNVVAEVVQTMNNIDRHSAKIADIISVIDGIAFQTNILALNAAVEAARAGEQGRGFAVVATEVRSLAQRSANAAREIKTLITASVESVESGSALVSSAGTTMGEVVASITSVREIVHQITDAARQQSTSIEQIHMTVSNLDQMTQQNAALVEQSAAAAESLFDQATKLTSVVSRFKLNT